MRDGDTFELERMPSNINNPESLASLSVMRQISAPPTILGSTSSVLNPGYMPRGVRDDSYRDIEGEVFTRTVEAPANQDNTIQRLEQLNQTVTAALQAGRTVASPAVAVAAAERQQLNFFPELNHIQSLFQTRDERLYRAAQESSGLELRQWGNVQRHAMSSKGLGGRIATPWKLKYQGLQAWRTSSRWIDTLQTSRR